MKIKREREVKFSAKCPNVISCGYLHTKSTFQSVNYQWSIYQIQLCNISPVSLMLSSSSLQETN